MKRIIAPTDFSAVSLNAVNYAADMAAALHAELYLLHVVQLPVTVAEMPLTEFEYEEMTNEAEKELMHLSLKLSERLNNKIKIHTRMQVGSVQHEIKEMSGLKQPFAIVMGTKGISAAERLFVGSNTIYAVNNIGYPVLVIPQGSSFNGIKSIASASDLDVNASVKAGVFLKEWLLVFHSQLHIINVSKPKDFDSNDLASSISLEVLYEEFKPVFHFLEYENIEAGIHSFLEQKHPDILMVIPKKQGLLSGLLHKSKSKPFILHPLIPVLAIAG